MQGLRLILIALVGLAALPAPAGALAQALPQAVATPDPCANEARSGGGAAGCFWNASINLGPMPQVLYWHIDRFADAASAESARTLYGRVTVALGGQIFLQTVNDMPGWSAAGGERIATVGPLLVPAGPDLTARFMELTLSTGGGPEVLFPSGPQALILLDGRLCIETPLGAQELEPGGSAIVPTGVPAAPRARGSTRALVLVVHPSAATWIGAPSNWVPAGRCTL
jgi:quercetin dioxygenase-like cupin family protein